MKFYPHFQTPFLDIKNYDFDIDVVRIIPEEMAREHKVIAIDNMNHILTIGMIHPEDTNLIEFLEQETKMMIIPFQITFSAWQEVIASAYIKEKELNWVG